MHGASEKSGRMGRFKFGPRHPYVIACVGFAVVLAVLLWFLPVPVETYKQLRGSLFTGIFAVSGFLLSAKSLVILNMKKEIYGEEWYLNRIHDRDWSNTEHGRKNERAKREACGATSAVYRPLAQVGALLTVNIIMALVAAFAQITLGLAETEIAVAICLSLAFSTALLLGCSVYLMWLNFETMYSEWEVIAQAKLDKRWDASLDDFHASAVHPAPGSPAKVKTVEADEELPPPK